MSNADRKYFVINFRDDAGPDAAGKRSHPLLLRPCALTMELGFLALGDLQSRRTAMMRCRLAALVLAVCARTAASSILERKRGARRS